MDPPPPYDSQSPQPPPYSADDKADVTFPPTWQPYNDTTLQHYPQHSSVSNHPIPVPPTHTQQPPPRHPVSVVILDTGHPSSYPDELGETYARHIALACIVMWCCNCLFGLVAYLLASMAQSATLVNRTRARRLGKASINVSLVGLIITVILTALIGGLCGSRSHCLNRWHSNCSRYEIGGVCYSSRRPVTNSNCHRSFDTCCMPHEDVYYKQYCYTRDNDHDILFDNPQQDKKLNRDPYNEAAMDSRVGELESAQTNASLRHTHTTAAM